MRFNRRHLLALGGVTALAASLRYARARIARPAPLSGLLSDAAEALVDRAWAGLDPQRVVDAHVHVVGIGTHATGCEVGGQLRSPLHPLEGLKFSLYLEASGVTDLENADQQYIDRLVHLLDEHEPHGRALLFAFDRAYDENGVAIPEATEFFTPNDYVFSLAVKNPGLFLPCASVHPYRLDALEALDRVISMGAAAIKWLPNAMNINPSSAKCDAFYEVLAKHRVPLICHAGEEKAVNAEDAQRLGNPLHLRRALEHGVTVVVAHCASLGQNPDLDAGPETKWVDNFDLFLRLMGEPQWEGRLFGELSAMTLENRVGRPIQHLLEHDALQGRLINGSDYPLPAINALMRTGKIEAAGLITSTERELLNEIDRHNPWLFDFVTKRTLRWKGRGFDDRVFMPAIFDRQGAAE